LTVPVLLPVGAMLLASASYAASGFYVKKRLSGAPTHTLALGQQLGALVWLAVPAVVWAPAAVPTGAALGAALALAVLSTTVAYLIYFRLLERIGPTRTSTVTYLLPAFGMLWGALFLGETITLGMGAGLALILVSLALINGGRAVKAEAVTIRSRKRSGGRAHETVR
jgi:drug/metabolite transporter (DMT)-like permease